MTFRVALPRLGPFTGKLGAEQPAGRGRDEAIDERVERLLASLPSALHVSPLDVEMHTTGISQRKALEAHVRARIEAWNDDPKSFVWTENADEILETHFTDSRRSDDSGH